MTELLCCQLKPANKETFWKTRTIKRSDTARQGKNIFYFDFCCSFSISKVKSYMKYYNRET